MYSWIHLVLSVSSIAIVKHATTTNKQTDKYEQIDHEKVYFGLVCRRLIRCNNTAQKTDEKKKTQLHNPLCTRASSRARAKGAMRAREAIAQTSSHLFALVKEKKNPPPLLLQGHPPPEKIYAHILHASVHVNTNIISSLTAHTRHTHANSAFLQTRHSIARSIAYALPENNAHRQPSSAFLWYMKGCILYNSNIYGCARARSFCTYREDI